MEKKDLLFNGGHQADIDIIENQDYLDFVKMLSFMDILMNNKGRNVRTILSYIWHLRSLPSYFQQLEMESLEKHANPDSNYKNTGQIILVDLVRRHNIHIFNFCIKVLKTLC